MGQYKLLALGALIASSAALPAPQNGPGQGGIRSGQYQCLPEMPQSACAAHCSLDNESPASWQESGAADLLDKWLAENGTSDWLKNMDSRYIHSTLGGDQGQSSLVCYSISGDCPGPGDTKCREFNPDTRFYWVRLMASRVQSMFKAANTALLKDGLVDALEIDGMVDTFKLPENSDNKELMQTIFDNLVGAAGLSSNDKISSGAGTVGFAGGLLSIVYDELKYEPEEIDYQEMKKEMKEQFRARFKATGERFDRMLSAIFGKAKTGDEDLLERVVTAAKNSGSSIDFGGSMSDSISNVLYSGLWLKPVSTGNQIEEEIIATIKSQRGWIVSKLLTQLGYVVLEWEAPSEEQCNLARTGRWIDDKCYMLTYRRAGDFNHKTIPEDHAKALETYGLPKLEDFYRSVRKCSNGEAGDFDISGDDLYPTCYFSVPFFIGNAQSRHPFLYSVLIPGKSTDERTFPYPGDSSKLPDGLKARAEGDSLKNRDMFTPRDEDSKAWDAATGKPRCVINSAIKTTYVEWGLERYRTTISSENLPEGFETNDMRDASTESNCNGASNRSGMYDDDGDSVFDMSFVRGPAGSNSYYKCMNEMRKLFQARTRCGTGSMDDPIWGDYFPWY
ncbi:hypothetical protein Q7P37_005536 [Cladosporium fusiforme]